ncbi:hypothetical protein H5410_035995 [Solanum commersonii]|uniref:Ubiquitin-like protease family profile domain-containing protein n=1 Tax=Solanum commersonii TaxID=4109 RepID=A0A9J5Y2A6_SOLCO|nr:hypothetical protein H5410_035995 [Solanum commersonii]
MISKAKNAMKSRLEVNLYKPLDVEKREIFSVFISKKEEERKMYLNGRFNYRLGEHDRSIFLFECKPILELWPKLLKQSGMFNHLSEIFLNDAWSYERLKNVPSNNSCAACGPYACVFIDHLLTGTDMSCLNDNEVDNFRMKYVVAVLEKELIP